ncbi:hypothetical protein [Lacimicrobium sp. SS2-24]|uniref:hypothetical protein n=1 Tax=Lacimicrobium sp. SS2-24 TaxID=2005569 RepID=UPI000B4BE171|nr:hypothetical protein [Lacimicrobium sp. SS2-24]
MKVMLRQTGVALIQVLLITGLILLLVIQISKDARHQVTTAQLWQDRVKAELALNNAQERLLFGLLTQERLQTTDTELTRLWNFHGAPFEPLSADNAKLQVTVQDMAGLASLTYSTDLVSKLMLAEGYSLSEAQEAIDLLEDWQGLQAKRNSRGPIQFRQELDFIKAGLSDVLSEELTTYHPVSYFNPGTAPNPLLALMLTDDSLDSVLERRQKGTITARELMVNLTPSIDDEVSDYPSEMLRLTLSSQVGETQLERSFMVRLQPEKSDPIIFLSE